MWKLKGTMEEQIPVMLREINFGAEDFRLDYSPPNTESGSAHIYRKDESDYWLILSGNVRECWAYVLGFWHANGGKEEQ